MFVSKIQNLAVKNKTSDNFDEMVSAAASATALSLTALLYVTVLTQVLGISGSRRSLILFASATTAIPMLCGGILNWSFERYSDARKFGILLSRATILILAIGLSTTVLIVCLRSLTLMTWGAVAWPLLKAAIAGHVATLAAGCFSSSEVRTRLIGALQRIPTVRPSFQSDVAFLSVLAIAMLIVFRVEPGNPLINVTLQAAFKLKPGVGTVALTTASAMAAITLLACLALIKLELRYREFHYVQPAQSAVLIFVIAAIFYSYFDTSLSVDLVHFLTNVGPATQVVYAGGVPMVSAFSQYGPGPLVVTVLAFLIGSPSFGAANIVSQLHSLLLYAVLMVCLFRMTRLRLAGLLLGFLAIGVVLAAWWWMNTIPSAMGLRYLPNSLVVLAISLLPKGRKTSPFLFLAMLLSAAWSFETLSGSVAISSFFVLLTSVEERSPKAFVNGIAAVILLPIAVATAFMTATTLVWTGEIPHFGAYLAFALIYNMTSDYWSTSPTGAYLGWIPILTAVMVTFSFAWTRAIAGHDSKTAFDSQMLTYRFAPMAALTAFMSSYFAGRSFDFTLIIAFVPLAVLVLPAFLRFFPETLLNGQGRKYQAVVPGALIFLALSFSFEALFVDHHPDSPLNQCVFRSNCSPAGLVSKVSQQYSSRPLIDQGAASLFDSSGLVQEAMALIDRYAPQRKQIPLFLGILPPSVWPVHTNTVLLYVHKGHRWPISFVATDELNATLWHLIEGADVKLEEGEVVFARTDEGRLDTLESAIMTRIRSTSRLCPLPGIGSLVTAYRVTFQKDCDESARAPSAK